MNNSFLHTIHLLFLKEKLINFISGGLNLLISQKKRAFLKARLRAHAQIYYATSAYCLV